MRCLMGFIGMRRTQVRMQFIYVFQDFAQQMGWDAEEAMHRMMYLLLRSWWKEYDSPHRLTRLTKLMEQQIDAAMYGRQDIRDTY